MSHKANGQVLEKSVTVVEQNAGLLTNFEVVQLLRRAGTWQRGLRAENDAGEIPEALYPQTNEPFAVEKQVFSVLTKNPAGKQTAENIAKFLDVIDAVQLTKAEKLQLLNLKPSSAVEIHLIVEDCEERLSAEEIEQIVVIVQELL